MSKINKYIEFIAECKLELLLEARIEYSNEFNSILYKISSPISKYLIDLEYKEVDVNTNYIDIIRAKDDVVYFKPDDKISNTKTPESVTNSEIKIGRLVNLLLKKAGIEVTGKQIEEFVDKYKAEIQMLRNGFERFKIVKGEDIRKWYLYTNYESQNGTLGKSCMKGDFCQPYFDIYTENTKNVSLIILESDEDKSKISGRAILWTDKDGKNFMDRVYVNNSPDITLFIEFANNNNFYYKSKQDSNEATPFKLDDIVLITSIVIQLPIIKYRAYPYMDTLKYYYHEKRILTNSRDVNDPNYYYLTGTRGNVPGECEFCGDEGTVDCPECDGTDPNCYFCEGNGSVDCPECNY